MKKFVPLALIASSVAVPSAVFAAETTQPVQAAADEVAGQVEVTRGAMLYDANGHRVANVYRVAEDGSPQVILSGRLITVPASSLSEVDGKIVTSLTKRDISRGN